MTITQINKTNYPINIISNNRIPNLLVEKTQSVFSRGISQFLRFFSIIGTFINKLKFQYRLNQWLSTTQLTSTEKQRVKEAFINCFNGAKFLRLVSLNIETLPEIFKFLPHIEKLTIANTQLKHLPEAIYNLANLSYLRFSGNGIDGTDRRGVTISPDVKNLKKLTHLDISDQMLADGVPVEISELTNLTLLNVQNSKVGLNSIKAEDFSYLKNVDIIR